MKTWVWSYCCANTALPAKKEKQRQSFNICRASLIRNRAGYSLHLVFLHFLLFLLSYSPNSYSIRNVDSLAVQPISSPGLRKFINLSERELNPFLIFCHIKWERFARRNLTNTFPLLSNRESGLSQNTTMNWESIQYCLPVWPCCHVSVVKDETDLIPQTLIIKQDTCLLPGPFQGEIMLPQPTCVWTKEASARTREQTGGRESCLLKSAFSQMKVGAGFIIKGRHMDEELESLHTGFVFLERTRLIIPPELPFWCNINFWRLNPETFIKLVQRSNN